MRALREVQVGSDGWAVALAGAVRAEFDVDAYQPAAGDPGLGRAMCRVGGCDGFGKAQGLCEPHHSAWAQEKPDPDGFVATASPLRRRPRRPAGRFELYGLGDVARREWCYVLQCRHDERGAPVAPREVSSLTDLVRCHGAGSLLDHPLAAWLANLATDAPYAGSHERALLRYAYARLEDLAAAGDPDVVYGRDTWDARRLGGFEPHRSPHRISFAAIDPAWLRSATKAWARFRLATGTRFSSVAGDVGSLRAFSGFLATRAAPVPNEAGIDRALIEDYLLALVGSGRSAATRTGLLVGLKLFFGFVIYQGALDVKSAGRVFPGSFAPRRGGGSISGRDKVGRSRPAGGRP